MAWEHRTFLLPPSSTPKGWADTLDDFADGGGFAFIQAIERVDGWLLIFRRQVADHALDPSRLPPRER